MVVTRVTSNNGPPPQSAQSMYLRKSPYFLDILTFTNRISHGERSTVLHSSAQQLPWQSSLLKQRPTEIHSYYPKPISWSLSSQDAHPRLALRDAEHMAPHQQNLG